MREEAFESKGYTGVDVFKLAQTLPVCKGAMVQLAGYFPDLREPGGIHCVIFV